MKPAYPKIGQFKTAAQLRDRLQALGLELPVDDAIQTAAAGSPLAEPLAIGSACLGNRWCIHPMEGWDANRDGSVTLVEYRAGKLVNFDRMDTDKDGIVSAAEMRAAGIIR